MSVHIQALLLNKLCLFSRARVNAARMLRFFLSHISIKMVKLDNKSLVRQSNMHVVWLDIVTRRNTARLVTVTNHTAYLKLSNEIYK